MGESDFPFFVHALNMEESGNAFAEIKRRAEWVSSGALKALVHLPV